VWQITQNESLAIVPLLAACMISDGILEVSGWLKINGRSKGHSISPDLQIDFATRF